MIKALIVDDNLLYVKNVFNTIINRIDNVHINYIATNVKEALQIINNNQIDLIFLNLKLPDGSGLDIITEVKCSNYAKKPNIIILSEYKELITNNLGDNIINVIGKLEENELIYNKILKSVNAINFSTFESSIKELVISRLTKIGYNWKYKGTLYILETIMYIYQHNNIDLLDNIEKNVYTYISYKHNKSINNIKTNIIKSTNSIRNNDYTTINLTPKFVISNILTEIINKYN